VFKGWWIVATHFVVMFFAVGLYQYGLPLLLPEVIEHFDTDAGTVNYLFTVHVAIGLVVGPIAGPFVDKWSARGLLVIGIVLVALGNAILGLAPNIWVFVVGGGVALGIAGVLCGPMTGSAVVSRFFTANRGRALGIAAVGTSAGGFAIPPLVALGVSTIGWQTSLLAFATAVLVCVVPLLLFRFWDHPEAAGVPAEPSPDGASPGHGDDAPPMTTREILTRGSFWLFTVSLALFIAVYTSTVFNLGLHFADQGIDASTAGRLMMIIAVGGMLGKLGFGSLADRVPLKVAFVAAIGATAGAIATLLLEPDFWGLVAAAALLGVATGGLLPVWNALVPRLFGVANFGRAMGLMGPVIAVTTMVVYPIVGNVRDATGSYAAVFQGDLAVLALAVAIVIPLREGARG